MLYRVPPVLTREGCVMKWFGRSPDFRLRLHLPDRSFDQWFCKEKLPVTVAGQLPTLSLKLITAFPFSIHLHEAMLSVGGKPKHDGKEQFNRAQCSGERDVTQIEYFVTTTLQHFFTDRIASRDAFVIYCANEERFCFCIISFVAALL